MIQIQVSGAAELAQKLRNLPGNLAHEINAAVNEMGESAASDIVQAATFENFTGTTRKTTRYVSNNDGSGGQVVMPLSGVFVDRARPHFVSMTADRPQLLAWGAQAQSQRIREAAAAVASGKRKSAPLFVQPHPFIARGFNKSQTKHEAILRKHLERAFL